MSARRPGDATERTRRSYEPPALRIVELDVMASFPDNCKMDVGTGGFGGGDFVDL